MSSSRLRVDWCSFEAAKYAVLNWHYSKSMPSGKLAKFGVWGDKRFAGTVIFGRGTIYKIGMPFGMGQTEVVELVRVALTDHSSPVSRIVRIALSMLKRQSPGLRVVVSFADPEQDHIGVIYQAGNWAYLGRPDRARRHMVVLGKREHSRTIGARYGTHDLAWLRQNVDPKAQYTGSIGKHKYAIGLDPLARALLRPMSKPYPKRPKDSSEPPLHHSGEGGAAPTRTLHTTR